MFLDSKSFKPLIFYVCLYFVAFYFMFSNYYFELSTSDAEILSLDSQSRTLGFSVFCLNICNR